MGKEIMSVGRALVYGGRGALGSTVVKAFKEGGWWVACVDMKPNELADHSIIVEGDTWGEQEQHVYKDVAEAVQAETLDAIVCMAGGWAGGSPASKDFVKNADAMWRQSVWPAAISAGLATKHLREGGICVLPGAAPAVGGTPGMAGYGMAKDCLSVALLPVTLDTPMNRKWMSKADTTTWTPLEFLSDLMLRWTKGDERPPSGSLVKLVTESSQTRLELL